MRFLDLKSNLNKVIKSCYTIDGNDDFLIEKAIEIIKSYCIKDFESFNFIKFDAEKSENSQIEPIISTLPIGGDIRLVVFYNISLDNNFKKMLNKYINISGQNQGVCLLFVKPKGNIAEIETVDCNKLDKISLKKWILNYLKPYDVLIEENALDYLIEISDSSLLYLNSELNKVASYCKAKQTIDIELLKIQLTKNASYFTYNLTNAIDNKNIVMAVEILNNLSQKDNIADIFAYIGSYFRRMFYCAISNQSDSELAKYLNVKPYAIKKSREYVIKNGKNFYIDLFNKYVNLDAEIKLGKNSAVNALNDIILGIKNEN